MEAFLMSLSKPTELLGKNVGQVVRLSFSGRLPGMSATVPVAEAFRAAVLSALHAGGGERSFLLSGHRADGSPDRSHQHAYYLPQTDTNGRIAEMIVSSPCDKFSKEELAAIQRISHLAWDGPSTKLHVEVVDTDDRSFVRVATRWISLTPYVPPRRFWGTHGKRHLVPEQQPRHL